MKCLYPLIGASLFWGVGFTSYTAFMGHLGAGNLEKGKLYGDRLAWISAIVGVACTIIMLLFTPLVMRFIKLTDGAQSAYAFF